MTPKYHLTYHKLTIELQVYHFDPFETFKASKCNVILLSIFASLKCKIKQLQYRKCELDIEKIVKPKKL